YSRITLLDAVGKKIDYPFHELDEELWDPSGKRFTLFVDPGRIKHGLKPREEVGPVFEAGKSYTLVVDAGWPDAAGNPPEEGYRKSFRAGPAEEKQPDIKNWKIQPPPANTKEPLTVMSPKA